MTRIHRSVLLPYRAEQLYELVNDVESYPVFMDGCVGARVLERGSHYIEARLDLSRGGISQSFSTRNVLEEGRAITMELLDGPFDRFDGRWDFRPLGDAGCKVMLHLQFRVASGVLGLAAAALFDRVSNNMVDAVTLRAHQLYG